MKQFILSVLMLLAWLSPKTALAKAKTEPRVVVAYVTSWSKVMPDPFTMTHINYAFGKVDSSFRGLTVDNPDRLRSVVGLKQKNPALKVVLSVGGWGAGNFSEMASTDDNRKAFAIDCRRVCREFGLDGIDIDWEYPTQNSAHISSSPADINNLSLLLAELRKALGRNRVLSMATVASGEFYDLKAAVRYLDFVNVMAYDMASPPHHHSALYASDISGDMTGDQAVRAHEELGVPPSKIVLGMPFYGRGENGSYLKTHDTMGSKYDERWSEASQVPYLAGTDGTLKCGFENSRSLAAKCQYIIDHHLRGAMYWEYDDDNMQGDGRRTLWQSLMVNNRATVPARQVLVMAERGTGHEGFVVAVEKWLNENAAKWNCEFTFVADMKQIPAGYINRFHVILQLNYPPYAWSEASQKDFMEYIDHGYGSYVGFHHATLLGDIFDGYKMWDWFSAFMGGIRFKNYIAPLSDGTVCVEDNLHPAMQGVPNAFVVPKDEFYTWDANPRRNVHVLAHVDEGSYTTKTDAMMGDHPVIWTNPAKKARNVYFQIGHHADLMAVPAFRTMFENALLWALYDK